MLKRIMALTLLSLLVVSGMALGADEKVKVAVWDQYISPKVVEDFENDHLVDVEVIWYSTYDDAINIAKNDSVDVIITGDLGVPILIKQDLVQPLDKSLLPNTKNLDPLFKGLSFDPQNKYSVPYHYINIGLVYHKDRVDRSEATLQNYFEAPEKFKGKLTTHPDKRIMIGMALKYMGISMNNREPENLELVKQLLTILKGNLTEKGKDMTRSVINPHFELMEGEADMAINYCAESTRRVLDASNVGYVLPTQGAIVGIDNFVIPKNSKHKELAHKFINYYYNPEVAATSVNTLYNPFPLKGVKELVTDELASNPVVFPNAEIIKNLEFAETLSEEKLKIYDEIWNEVFEK